MKRGHKFKLKFKKMLNICDFGRILKTECNLLHFTRNCGINNLNDFEAVEADIYLWRAGSSNMKEKGTTISYHHYVLRGGKVNVVEH